MNELTFSCLQAANVERAVRWHKDGLDKWSVNDWLTAFGGEAGEALNAGKKHRRVLDGIQQHGNVPADLTEAEDKIMQELADAVIYADLVASRLGRRLSDAIVAKFNAISEREGFPERLGVSAVSQGDSWLAWMIERKHPSGGAQYLTMTEHGSEWVDDPLTGLHFVRREDAERFAAGREDAEAITQHEFVDPPWKGTTHSGRRGA